MKSENQNDRYISKETGFNLTSILKYLFGVISGSGIACAFLITPLFFIQFGLGFIGYALVIEKERAKKNPPT